MSRLLARAILPATLGEWVQGWIGGRESLVSLVVGWRGAVELRLSEPGDANTPIVGKKASAAFDGARGMYPAIPNGTFINVVNPHPASRGLATSTMDVAGVYASCAAYAGANLSDEDLLSLCAAVEPSDGIMFEGLAHVDHLCGELIERLPAPPEMRLVAVIPDRTLDTLDYRRDGTLSSVIRGMAPDHEEAYEILRGGLLAGNSAMIAEAATISASLQQRVIPKDEWETMLDVKAKSGALGIAAAHSGTASALIFGPDDEERAEFARKLLQNSVSGEGDSATLIKRVNVEGGGAVVSALCL
jgi:L-threonine kinase